VRQVFPVQFQVCRVVVEVCRVQFQVCRVAVEVCRVVAVHPLIPALVCR